MIWCVYGDRNPAAGWQLTRTPGRPRGYWLPVCRQHHPDDLELAA